MEIRDMEEENLEQTWRQTRKSDPALEQDIVILGNGQSNIPVCRQLHTTHSQYQLNSSNKNMTRFPELYAEDKWMVIDILWIPPSESFCAAQMAHFVFTLHLKRVTRPCAQMVET
jgi:hypothetical protein